ncbi:hypothetical protein D3C72_1007340 [compost metagenome]
MKAVVPVDHPAVEVVEVGGREAAAVQLDHGAEIRRDHGDHVEDHPGGVHAGGVEGVDDAQALDGLGALLTGGRVDLGLQVLAQLEHVHLAEQFLDGVGAHLRDEVGLLVGVQGLEVIFGDGLALLEVGVARIEHDVRVEVDDVLQRAQGDVEKEAQVRRDALQVPDMRDRGGQLDVAHAVAADLRVGDFDAAALADDALVADALVLPAVALPVLGGPEDPLAEKTVALGLERTVVDRLGLGHLTARPGEDALGRGDADLDVIELLTHRVSLLLNHS